MDTIKSIIDAKLADRGRLTFADYMATALYHPEIGYYNRSEMTVGEGGDFFTSPMVHPIFGACVARQVYEFWQLLGTPEEFLVLEMGAGVGTLAADFLRQSSTDAAFLNALRYVIVEVSPNLRAKQQETLSQQGILEKVSWYGTLEETRTAIGPQVGVVMTNELFDALPVHRLVKTEDGYAEYYVERDGDGYREVQGPLSDDSLPQWIDEESRSHLDPGDRFEVCPSAADVIREMGELLERGFVLTIDYGNLAPEVHLHHVSGDGVRAFYKQAAADPLERVGLQDLTADVDFSLLIRSGEDVGLREVGFTTQLYLLGGNGILHRIYELQQKWFDLDADAELQKMLGLFLPKGLGDLFKVLVQVKGLEPEAVREKIGALTFRLD
ncbi:MAG TPA: SAM-dependent methyltransferase [Bacilli bacterium]|nr:SAM-dependent methyltransferase [Bacilli bacterium]